MKRDDLSQSPEDFEMSDHEEQAFVSANNAEMRCALVLVLCLGLGACSKSSSGQVVVYPTGGSIVFDGTPLAGAKLFFHAETPLKDAKGKELPTPNAFSKPDGTFSAMTFAPGDGLPIGDFKVTVSCPDHSGKLIGDTYPELLPAKYQDPATSGLTVNIKAGRNRLDQFQLAR